MRRAEDILRPTIEERMKHSAETNVWDDKPNDLLQWLIDAAKGAERSVQGFTMRILVVAFAALHTSSMVRALNVDFLVVICCDHSA